MSTWNCGHPKTPENTRNIGGNRVACRECRLAYPRVRPIVKCTGCGGPRRGDRKVKTGLCQECYRLLRKATRSEPKKRVLHPTYGKPCTHCGNPLSGHHRSLTGLCGPCLVSVQGGDITPASMVAFSRKLLAALWREHPGALAFMGLNGSGEVLFARSAA